MSAASAMLAASLAWPLATPAAAPAPLEAATRALTAAYADSIVDRLCNVQMQIDQAAANVRRERPDLGDAQIEQYKQHLATSAPDLRAACGQRVREALAGEDGPLAHYAGQVSAELSKSPAPHEFEQLRAFLDSPAGRHAEAARRTVDADAYLSFVRWAQRFAPRLYDELGMMLRADVGPLPPKAEVPVQPASPAAAGDPPVEHARVRNGATLGSACASFYPATSRRVGEEGSVVLLVYVLSTGRIGSVLVETTSGFPGLDVAAAACIGAVAEFEPQKREGQAVSSWQRMKWTWRLTE